MILSNTTLLNTEAKTTGILVHEMFCRPDRKKKKNSLFWVELAGDNSKSSSLVQHGVSTKNASTKYLFTRRFDETAGRDPTRCRPDRKRLGRHAYGNTFSFSCSNSFRADMNSVQRRGQVKQNNIASGKPRFRTSVVGLRKGSTESSQAPVFMAHPVSRATKSKLQTLVAPGIATIASFSLNCNLQLKTDNLKLVTCNL